MLEQKENRVEKISLANWTQVIKPPALRSIHSIISRPGILSFALGQPASDLFPVEKLSKAAAKLLAINSSGLQYELPSQRLKSQIVELMALRGVACEKEQIFLTAGAQQAMALLARLLLNNSGQVLTEEVTYEGLYMVISPYLPNIWTVSTDLESGMNIEAIEQLLQTGARPAFIYSITDGHNPLGISMRSDKRVRLVEIARQYRIPIIEDDAYGFVYYESASEPPLRALDEEWVLYVGSFSKILAPGLRVGWIVAPEELISKLSFIKQAIDIDVSTLSQQIISTFLDEGFLPDHLVKLREGYKLRRDAMLEALDKYFPKEARWRRPTNGIFIWIELPDRVDTNELFRIAVERENVAFIPGHVFSINESDYPTHCMRLNFSNCPAEQIEEGIIRLARVLDSFPAGR
jgi:2-aminoadipate transaminase